MRERNTKDERENERENEKRERRGIERWRVPSIGTRLWNRKKNI
jgi:hypothetical protein